MDILWLFYPVWTLGYLHCPLLPLLFMSILVFHPNPGRVCLFVGGKRWGERRPPEKRWHLGWVLKVSGSHTLVLGWLGYIRCRVPDTWSIGVGQTWLFNSFWTEGLWKEVAFARHWAHCPKHWGRHWCVCGFWASGFCPVQFSHSVVSNSLQHHGLQHTRLPCPSPTPGAYSN